MTILKAYIRPKDDSFAPKLTWRAWVEKALEKLGLERLPKKDPGSNKTTFLASQDIDSDHFYDELDQARNSTKLSPEQLEILQWVEDMFNQVDETDLYISIDDQ